ncbi:MAG: ribonuclease HII [Flavobacteriaceae bacterium]
MKKILVTFLLFFILIGCNSNTKNTIKLSSLIPENTTTVLKISDFESFKNDLKNNDFFNKTFNKHFKLLDVELIKNLKTVNPVLLCLSNAESDHDISIITKYNDSLFSDVKIDSTVFFYKLIDSFYVASTSKNIIEKLLPKPNLEFDELTKTANSNASFSIYLNQKKSDSLGQALLGQNPMTKAFMFDASLTSGEINLNGIAKTDETNQGLLNIFNRTTPQENTLSNIAPNDSKGFLSFTFNNYDILKSNIEDYTKTKIDSTLNDFWLHSINEIGEVFLDNSSVIIAKSLDPTTTKDGLLEHQDITSTFREINILQFNTPHYFKTIFNPLVSDVELNFYTILENYFVFGNSESDLQTIIANFQNGATLIKNQALNNSYSNISDESSLLLIANSDKLEDISKKIFNLKTANISLSDYKFSTFQFVQDEDFMHVNINLNKNKSRANSNTISEEFNITLDTDVLTNPQFVTNYRNNQEDIVVQDINNNLYLISNQGKILWKKRLSGNILGKIQQIDIYKNGRLQLAFATPKRVYVIDRNGNDVGPFPLNFNDNITQPLSVFDYDNNKNYRLLVTQGNDLLMYNVNGKSVNGFNYQKASEIKTQPQHFRINGKDYIVFAAGNSMKILNRQGQTRINVKESIDFSENDIYLYKDLFTTTNRNGELVQVNSNGSVSKQSLKLDKNHGLTATSKTLVTLSENNLNIKQNSFELDFGNYSKPNIFYLNDKIYVTVTDLQTNKIYLFDSLAKIQNNFPVFGNSVIDLKNIDKDSNLEFVTIGDSNSIIIYQKN